MMASPCEHPAGRVLVIGNRAVQEEIERFSESFLCMRCCHQTADVRCRRVAPDDLLIHKVVTRSQSGPQAEK